MSPEFQQIYWFSGIYLQPQHLQSIDLHHSYMLSRHRQFSQPWNFGIIQCDFNPDILVDFTLKIEHLQSILPSGDYLEFPGNAIIQPYRFRDTWLETGKPLTLWLALRRFDRHTINVGNTSDNRWVKSNEEETMKDVYFQGPECSVSRILYNVQILSEAEKNLAVNCECLPLMRLSYSNNRVIIEQNYCPPVITINSSGILKNILDGIYAELNNYSYTLSGHKRVTRQLNSNNSNIDYFLIMQIVNRNLPLLHHYCNSPGIHPWLVYGFLAQLIGELSNFSSKCSYKGEWSDGRLILLPYDHYRIYESFISIKTILTALLNDLIRKDTTEIRLHRDEQSIFRGNLQTLPLQKMGVILLLLESNMKDLSCIDCLEFKIASELEISSLILHALPGIELVPTPSPLNIPESKCIYYFTLNQHDLLWQHIEQQKNIAFYWAHAPIDLSVQIMFMESE